ncbi:hypothetical protein FE840_000985 [Peteryoungia desertarenae]|uniref:Uncharacterized protein n=1 Tax=Peteryoungia desertarenae TaxID=1813451 RepID=A0ABX6QI39_9HYPH|nr:hypothetical protein [Peteryoungia desertarenae]QLF68239.1 hypothetical protein FE840_000985 [Peteryoungia desertarenae]
MKTELHRLQPDPPEGDRKTIERELERQERAEQDKNAHAPESKSAGAPHQNR